jgi:Zn finger protein HypA/HybF involved in hydrogenase expression
VRVFSAIKMAASTQKENSYASSESVLKISLKAGVVTAWFVAVFRSLTGYSAVAQSSTIYRRSSFNLCEDRLSYKCYLSSNEITVVMHYQEGCGRCRSWYALN